jgi:hypothetical protein
MKQAGRHLGNLLLRGRVVQANANERLPPSVYVLRRQRLRRLCLVCRVGLHSKSRRAQSSVFLDVGRRVGSGLVGQPGSTRVLPHRAGLLLREASFYLCKSECFGRSHCQSLPAAIASAAALEVQMCLSKVSVVTAI